MRIIRISSLHKIQNNLGTLKRDFRLYRWAYIMVIPVVLYYLIFCYVPMYGAIIAFKNYNPILGVIESPWAGLTHFKNFFQDYYFWRIIGNTFKISLLNLLFGFPAPIIFALLLNEIHCRWFKRVTQTISYFPYFISLVVVCGIIKNFLLVDGAVNDIVAFFGGERISFLQDPRYFRTIYVASGIWQNIGWGSILYLSVLASINPEYYEAATIDGAGRFRQVIHITIPSLLPTVVIMFILAIGSILNVGFEKIILLYNPVTYKTADVISSYVYRKGLQESNFSYSTAVGLFNSVCNFVFICMANRVSRVVGETSLW